MWIVYAPRLFRLLTPGSSRYTAMALWPVVISGRPVAELDPGLIRHERIHFRQQTELLLIPFYLWYILEYLVLLIKYRNHYLAYRNIVFEREAAWYQEDPEYLQRRRLFGFLAFYAGARRIE